MLTLVKVRRVLIGFQNGETNVLQLGVRADDVVTTECNCI